MALELIQAIRMASRWLWSSSRPSGWLPDGSGAHPGHQDSFPMALELIQAIRMASRWLWSSSRPSELHPNGLEANIRIGSNIQTKKWWQHYSNRIESNSNTRID
ncbi:hypothetical protein H4Q26_010445 [Puccinia striiformis f. sp. tritici PST-130]|nr:hypothetical protein H4Q26_010445 [Puccinia striiformis f. sp. tritici PST-130]